MKPNTVNMVEINLYHNETRTRLFFYELIVGLAYVSDMEFDYIIVDNSKIQKHQFNRYFRTMNEISFKSGGSYIEELL